MQQISLVNNITITFNKTKLPDLFTPEIHNEHQKEKIPLLLTQSNIDNATPLINLINFSNINFNYTKLIISGALSIAMKKH